MKLLQYVFDHWRKISTILTFPFGIYKTVHKFTAYQQILDVWTLEQGLMVSAHAIALNTCGSQLDISFSGIFSISFCSVVAFLLEVVASSSAPSSKCSNEMAFSLTHLAKRELAAWSASSVHLRNVKSGLERRQNFKMLVDKIIYFTGTLCWQQFFLY